MNEYSKMGHTNGGKWLSRMTETLVALLLASAAGGAIWSAVEVRSLSVKIDSMTERVDRHEKRIEQNAERILRRR